MLWLGSGSDLYEVAKSVNRPLLWKLARREPNTKQPSIRLFLRVLLPHCRPIGLPQSHRSIYCFGGNLFRSLKDPTKKADRVSTSTGVRLRQKSPQESFVVVQL